MMPGIAQAKLDSNGMNARPDSPTRAHQPVEQVRGTRQVAAVLEHQDEQEQDQDLRQEHQHAADARDDAVDEQAAQRALRQERPRAPRQRRATPASMRSIGSAAQLNTAWKTRNSSAPRITRPSTGCMTIASILSAHAVPQRLDVTGRAWRIRAPRACVASISVVVRRLPAPRAVVPADSRAGKFSRCATSAASPSALTATVGTTGTPSSAASRATSSSKPRRAARSLMLSATTIGRPRCLQLEHEPQVEAQVGGVDDADDELRRGSSADARATIARDRFVERSRRQAVRAGQVGPRNDDRDRGPTNDPSLRSTVTPA